MSKPNGRKVKSLNDIPKVFKSCELFKPEIPFKNGVEQFEKSNEKNQNIYLSYQIIPASKNLKNSGSSSVSDFHRVPINSEKDRIWWTDNNTDKELKECDKQDDELENCTEINPLGGANGSREFPEERKLSRLFRKSLKKKQKHIVWTIDNLLLLIIITPVTIAFWHSTWTYMDIYANMLLGSITFIFGILVHTCFAIAKDPLHVHATNVMKKKTLLSKIFYKVVQIPYTYVFSIACNIHWWGGFIIFDYFFSNVWATIAATITVTTLLIILRAVRNLLAVPHVIIVDRRAFAFRFPTRFKLNTRDWLLYLLDCAFSVGVVGTLVVFVWRGTWILFELYLFPDDRKYSAIGSLAIGYVLVTVTFSLQPLMRYVCARLQGLARLIVADGFLLLSFLGTVNVWRGIWTVLDIWLVPENKELSCWITHVGCFVFLVLLNCSNSILVRGVYIDAEEDDGKCVAFPCHYLRLFFKVEREKKEARRRNLLVASKDFRPRPDGNTKDAENGALLPNSTTTTILPSNPESLV